MICRFLSKLSICLLTPFNRFYNQGEEFHATLATKQSNAPVSLASLAEVDSVKATTSISAYIVLNLQSL